MQDRTKLIEATAAKYLFRWWEHENPRVRAIFQLHEPVLMVKSLDAFVEDLVALLGREIEFQELTLAPSRKSLVDEAIRKYFER